MTLAETQALLAGLISRSAEVEPERLGAVVRLHGGLAPSERVEIYAEMYLTRLVEALRVDFPKLAELLGEAEFRAAVEAYASAVPSRSPDLGRYGAGFPAFIAERGSGRADLKDLALLEWTRAEVLTAQDGTPLGREAMAVLPPERMGEARFAFVPALRLLRLSHDVAPVWRALDEDQAPAAPRRATTELAVWRRGFDVYHATLEPLEAAALRCARGGGALADVCEVFVTHGDGAAAAAFRAVASWFEEQWVEAVRCPD